MPIEILNAFNKLNFKLIYEIRLRANLPIKINYDGKYCALSKFGITNNYKDAMTVTEKDIENIIYIASEYSIYSVADEMREGFITTKKGVRIGIAGTFVYDQRKIIAVRNITSICIRIPHEIKGCADEIFQKCLLNELNNCIVLSPPGMGKTTILRELSCLLSEKYDNKNILIADERGEISAFSCGKNCDIIKYGKKKDVFEYAIRAMRPDILITDELLEEDHLAVRQAVQAGITIFASAHFDFRRNYSFNYFDRYIYLKKDKIGQIERITQKNGENI